MSAVDNIGIPLNLFILVLAPDVDHVDIEQPRFPLSRYSRQITKLPNSYVLVPGIVKSFNDYYMKQVHKIYPRD